MKQLDYEKEIDKLRIEIEKHQDKHIFLVEQNITISEIEEKLCNYIDSQAKNFSRLDSLIGYASSPDMSAGFLHDAQAFQTTIFNNSIDMGPLLCTLFGSEIKKKLKQMVKTKNIPNGLPRGEANKQIYELEKIIYELGIKEESLICQAEDAGYDIARRVDCDPKVVLNFREVA